MGIEIRPCQPEEMEEYFRVDRYVFAINEVSESAAVAERSTQPEWTTCAFVDGRLATTMAAFPFNVRFNGARAPMAGVTGVGTLPQYRRQGLLRQVMAEGLRSYREQGQYLAILWASMGAIYQRFGYGLASSMVTSAFDPRNAAFAEPRPVNGSVDLMSRDDAYPIIKQLYVQYATPRNLLIHRPSPLWEGGVLRADKKALYIAVYRDAAGEPAGYVVYQTEQAQRATPEPGPDQRMTIKELVALDADAYRGLWQYVCSHDLVGEVVWNNVSEDDPGFHLLLEPRYLNRRTFDGVWLRVVDVERGLPLRPYGDDGAITFRVAGDDLCPWNEGTHRLDAGPGGATVQRRDDTPDLVLPPRALASLVAGHASATHLSRCGLLEAESDAALRRADRIFATEYRPYCPDGF